MVKQNLSFAFWYFCHFCISPECDFLSHDRAEKPGLVYFTLKKNKKKTSFKIPLSKNCHSFYIPVDGLYVLEEISILTNWPNRGKGFDLSAFTRESYLQVKGKKSCGFQGFMKATPNHSATSGSCFFLCYSGKFIWV